LFGRLRALIDAGEANLEVALNNQRAVLKEVTVGVVRAYLEWEAARQRVQLIKADIRALEDTREVMALRVEEGISPNLDLARADTLLEQQRAKLPDARAQLYRAKAVLSVRISAVRSQHWPGMWRLATPFGQNSIPSFRSRDFWA